MLPVVALVGRANVGKSTLFNALLKKQMAYVAYFPFATIEPNICIVPVPDERLTKLSEVTKESEKLSFSSTAHGAGRAMSRHEALRHQRGEQVKKNLEEKGIDIEAGSWRGLAEEAPESYKDIDEVVKVSHKIGIGNLVARMKPIAVMKG